MIAIPAIDLIDGQVVRLLRGDFGKQTSYDRDPLAYAHHLFSAGLNYLHLVDLSGAKLGKLVHVGLLQSICDTTSLKVDFGGGVQSETDIQTILGTGASQVVVGSLCVKQPALVAKWIRKYGVEKFLLAIDTDGQSVKINGWQDGSGKTLTEVVAEFSAFNGITVLTTDIRRDGTGTGANTELYYQLVNDYPTVRWIASGGVESLSDLEKLREAGCYGCVIGKALLEGRISPEALVAFNERNDV